MAELATTKKQLASIKSRLDALEANASESPASQNPPTASFDSIVKLISDLKNSIPQIVKECINASKPVNARVTNNVNPTMAEVLRNNLEVHHANNQSPPNPPNRRREVQIENLAKNKLLKKNKDTTMALALKQKPVTLMNRFNILADLPTQEEALEVIDQIEHDHDVITRCGPVTLISKKSPTLIAVTASTKQVADCMKNTLATKYPRVKISSPSVEDKFLIKVTGCEIDEEDDASFLDSLKSTNSILQEADVSIVRSYTINNGNRPYKNYVLKVPEDVHYQVIQNGKLFVNFLAKNCYEYVDILQCKNCWRFGHLHFGCKFKKICKRCGASHDDPTENCEAALSCSNCTRHSKLTGESLKKNHFVTSDRCPCIISRIEHLKNFHLNK